MREGGDKGMPDGTFREYLQANLKEFTHECVCVFVALCVFKRGRAVFDQPIS